MVGRRGPWYSTRKKRVEPPRSTSNPLRRPIFGIESLLLITPRRSSSAASCFFGVLSTSCLGLVVSVSLCSWSPEVSETGGVQTLVVRPLLPDH